MVADVAQAGNNAESNSTHLEEDDSALLLINLVLLLASPNLISLKEQFFVETPACIAISIPVFNMPPLQLVIDAYITMQAFLGSGYQEVLKWLQVRGVRASGQVIVSWVYNHGFEAISWAGHVALFLFNVIVIWIMSRGTGTRMEIPFELLHIRHFRVSFSSVEFALG